MIELEFVRSGVFYCRGVGDNASQFDGDVVGLRGYGGVVISSRSGGIDAFFRVGIIVFVVFITLSKGRESEGEQQK